MNKCYLSPYVFPKHQYDHSSNFEQPLLTSRATLSTRYKRVTYIPLNNGGKKRHEIIFLEILGTVESSLCHLSTLVRYSLPVRLTHHEADSALSICFLLLFQIGPSNLDKTTRVSCYSLSILPPSKQGHF